jgi:DNA-binding LacI/PurR family transcriptional regulator
MGTFPKQSDYRGGESSTTLLPGPALPEYMSRRITASRGHGETQKSVLILRLLRRKALGSRNKKPQPFYSIRAVANHFGVPATTVSRIYNQLKSEGLLTSVWGSKTFVEPAKIDNQVRVRAIVALPASITSFCTLRQYRIFFVEMRDALWKFGFATRLLFYEGNNGQLPSFAEFLLGYRPDIVIWFLPNLKIKGTVARLLDRGTRVITVADSPCDCRAHHYYVDRERAVKNALLSWQQNGIRSVTVLQDSHCRSVSTVALVEKCLRDTAMPHAFANAESWQLQDTHPAYAQRANRGVIFPSSELAVALTARDPARFAKLLERSRILLMDGPIDMPGSYAVKPSIDVVEVDLQSVAKRIAGDLIQSTRSRSAEPVTFQAKWIPGAINNRLVTPHSVQPRCDAQAHRLGESRIAV